MRVFVSSSTYLLFILFFCYFLFALAPRLRFYSVHIPHIPPHKDIPSAQAGFTVISFFVFGFCYYFLAKCLLFTAPPSSNITICFLCLAFLF